MKKRVRIPPRRGDLPKRLEMKSAILVMFCSLLIRTILRSRNHQVKAVRVKLSSGAMNAMPRVAA
jgi:hypothetical protein